MGVEHTGLKRGGKSGQGDRGSRGITLLESAGEVGEGGTVRVNVGR